MNRLLFGAMALALIAMPVHAQSLEDLNIQIHGYATQGFLYTNQNNFLTTESSGGSPAWSEAVVNLGSQPIPKLRVGVQARYFVLGNLGNEISLDWAHADYRASEAFGVRFGKVKTPSGLMNDMQDIDPSYMWALLPQSVYPIMNRNGYLAHYGGVVYGTVKLGKKLGKLEYRGWGGERVLSANDGYVLGFTEGGFVLPNNPAWKTFGGALHWKTPLQGLMFGISQTRDLDLHLKVALANTPYSGYVDTKIKNGPTWFGRYEKNKWMVAAESARSGGRGSVVLTGLPISPIRSNYWQWYGMVSYKVTDKLITGGYFSQRIDHDAALGPARFQRDWTLSGRYDFNNFLYAKVEQHFIKGTVGGFDRSVNPDGLKPNTNLTILKVGVSF